MSNPNSTPGAAEYSDGVIAYHQYKADLGLTVAEATTHPDTQEAFLEITEIVTNNPELVTVYTGVLKASRKQKAESIGVVRSIELDIIDGQYDAEAITSAKHDKERKALQDNKTIVKRAETFVKLFKSVIDKEELPPRKRRPRKTKRPVEVEPANVEQDTEFHVSLDEDETIFVNGKKPMFVEAQDVIFRILLDEANGDGNAVAPSYCKHTAAWKRYIDGDEYSSHRLFTTGMRGLRQTLENNGLGNMIEQVGSAGRGTAYKMNLTSYTSEAEQTTKPAPEPEITQPAAIPVATQQPRLRFYDAQRQNDTPPVEASQTVRSPREQLIDMQFAKRVIQGIAQFEAAESTEDQQGVAQPRLVKALAEALDMEPEAVVHMVRALRNSGDLFISAKQRGTRFISTQPPAQTEAETSQAKEDKAKAEHERIQKLREEYGTKVLRFLATLSHREQTEFKTAIAEAVEGLDTKDVNAVCNLLRTEGLVRSKEEQGRGSRRGRKGKTWAVTGRGRSVVSREDNQGRLTNAQKRSYSSSSRY